MGNIQSPQWNLLGQTKNYQLKGRYRHFCKSLVILHYHCPRSEPLGQPALAPILNRSLPGGCLPVNKGTLAWGQDGLLAYAAHSNVVVIEPTTVQTFQCLTRYTTHDIWFITHGNQAPQPCCCLGLGSGGTQEDAACFLRCNRRGDFFWE